MRAIGLLAPILSICCAGSAALAQTFDANEHKYLYVEPCRANVQSVFKDGMGQIFVVSVGLSIRNSGIRPIDGVTVDLLDKFDNVLSAKTRQLAVKPGEARADTIEIWWPSGLKQSFRNVEADKFFLIEEGSDRITLQPFVRHVSGP